LGRRAPEDETFVWWEYSVAGFEDHAWDCRHCWTLAIRPPNKHIRLQFVQRIAVGALMLVRQDFGNSAVGTALL